VAPPDISKWDLICFCITSVNTPHFAVRADTNGQILYYAQNGATKAQLEQAMGARVLMSQLDLLQDWRLLKRNGDAYTTNIPVLGPEKVGELRRQMKNLASQIVPEIRPEVQKIAAELQQRRLPDHLYSVLFSYVLDGQTWDQLRSSKAIPEMRITANHPFWDGTFWALYPNRTAEPGTDSTGPDGITLLMTWTDPVLRQLHALQNAPKLTSMLQQASRGDCRNLSIEDAEHKQWTLSGPDGACIFPVIHENASDAIYKAGEQRPAEADRRRSNGAASASDCGSRACVGGARRYCPRGYGAGALGFAKWRRIYYLARPSAHCYCPKSLNRHSSGTAQTARSRADSRLREAGGFRLQPVLPTRH
jgi:hypothetical protein